jgi:hypothetical protein
MNMTIGRGQTLAERIWSDQVKTLMPQYVRIIGRVIGAVSIRDISREVLYNQTVDISANDAKRSKDLLDARDNKWIDIVYGAEYLQKQVVKNIPTQNMQQQQFNLNDIKSFATQIAQSAAEQAADKSVSSIRDMLKDMNDKLQSGSNLDANQVVGELLKRLPAQAVDTKKVDDVASNVFVNLDEGKVLQSNIQEGKLGEVTVRDGVKAKTAIKKLKNIQNTQ